MGPLVSPEGWHSPRASEAGTLVVMTDGVTLKGREQELSSLQRVLDPNGARVAFVYGVAGIGKSALLNAFASRVRDCSGMSFASAWSSRSPASAAGMVSFTSRETGLRTV